MNKRLLAMVTAGALIAAMMAFGSASAARQAAPDQVVHGSTETVKVRSVGGSGVAGEAVFSYNVKARLTTVRLAVRHLKVGSIHPAAIRSGRCGQNGAILYPFAGGSIHAGAGGMASAVVRFKETYVGRLLYVGVQQGPGAMTRTGRRVIACGNVM